ncbi:unnamed protein product [Didymodactylos carnosus]|uniref:Uncharacterized protein n=2 Tax=Didymodactylos carnosus TaxID=1234261 RepID=A0A8S2F9U4_9BILA|nr:unnamed protein product [Didymodactylos carnosus]CAF4203679.1 unnamed protein product [Didymodactylos carnosus]
MKDHYLGYYPTKYIEETYAEALSTRDEVLTLWFEYINDDELNCSVDIGKIYKGIGDCYPEELNDHTMAIKHYDLAIDYFQLANQKATTDYEKIDIFDLLRDVYTSKMEISIDESEQIQNCLMAITHIELSVQNLLKYRSSDYYGIATRIEEIANLYQSIFKYDDALINYEKALEVYMQQFKPVLYRIKVTFEKIFKICYDHKHDYSSALKYQLMEHEYVLKHNARKPTDNMTEMCAKREEIVKSHIKLANVYITLHQYSLAEEHLMIIKKLYQESELPSQGKVEFIEEKLGNLYTRLHKHDLADKHLAMEKNLYQKTKNPLAELHIRHPIGYLAQKQKCAFFRFK